MANYKLPWNYEPGVDDALIALNNSVMGPYDYAPILTHYESKWSDTYCYDPTNDAIIEYPYQINVAVHRANDTQEGHYAFVTEAEQLKTTYYLTGSHQFAVQYPAVWVQSDWNCYTAKSNNWYQLVKETLENSSSWVDTSSWSNTTLSTYQYNKYFIPINTNINLSEEFRLRWYNHYASINNLTYSLPSTYFVENNFDNFAYSSTDNTINPKVYDSNNNLVTGALTRVNGQWILNLNAVGTYHIYGYYVWNRHSLKPSTTEDVNTASGNYDMAAWDVVVEAYNQDIAKTYSSYLNTYRTQGYDYLMFGSYNGSIGNAYWSLYDDAGTNPLQTIEISDDDGDYLGRTVTFSSSSTYESLGLATTQLRGPNTLRKVNLYASLGFFWEPSTHYTTKLYFTPTKNFDTTDSSLGFTLNAGDRNIIATTDMKYNTDSYKAYVYCWIDGWDQWFPMIEISILETGGLRFKILTYTYNNQEHT